jgi:amino acid adenylation domain-containing protein
MIATETASGVLDGFARVVALRPDAPAVSCGNTRLDYGELDARANALAHRLSDCGVGLEDVVALAVDRSVDLAVGVLGVLKAGAAYLPLDREWPLPRTQAVVAEASASVLVTDREHHPFADAVDWEFLVVLDGDHSTRAPARTTTRDALQYVIYTSGSTGQPKGIAMSHGPQITLLEWCLEHYATTPVALQYFPLTTDVASLELFAAWWAGGEVVIATDAERYDIDALIDVVERRSVSRVLLPVRVLHELARRLADTPERLASVREFITTGDKLTITPALRELLERLPESILDDHYGSTEINVVTAPRLVAPTAEWPDRPPLGRPIAGARIYVLDDALNPVPPNVLGEMYVGGEPLSRGYLRRGNLTAEAYLPDPFNETPGARIYRTGDLARWRSDGVLVSSGRRDSQVKFRGYRLELGEIEALLRLHEGVAGAAAVVRERENEEPLLIAYVTSALPLGEVLHIEELRRHLSEQLPAYMMPDMLVVLDEFPLTESGKIDRRRLPNPEDVTARFVAPRDELEAEIAAVWAESLGVDELGVRDNFFRLGGHSLLVTRIVYELRDALGVDIPLEAMFRRPTVESLATEVRSLLTA